MATNHSVWEYDAPQYVDFTQPNEDDNPEEYFGYSHEDLGIPVSFSESRAETSILHNYSLRSSSSNTPQRTGTAKRNLPNRSALKDMNNLTPHRSNQNNSENTPQTVKTAIHFTDEKENDFTPTKTKTVESGLGITTEEMNKRSADSLEVPVSIKSPPARSIPKGRSTVDKVTKQGDNVPPIKRLKRSASSAMTRPRRSVVDRQSPQIVQQPAQTRVHTRSLSADTATRGRQETPRSTTKISSQAQSKMHSETASFQSNPRAHSVDRSRSTGGHQRTASSGVRTRSVSNDRKINTKKQAPKMTNLKTPAVLKHQSMKSSDLKSTEERQIDQINILRKELVDKRKLAMHSMKVAQSSVGYMPVRAVQPATKPKQFHFKTDERVKGADVRKEGSATEIDFATTLRRTNQETKKSADHNTSAPKCTIPQPFKLHKNKHNTSDQNRFQSTAEIMLAFSTKTPERFRTKPKNKEPTPTRKRTLDSTEPSLTVAKTPKLETRNRFRPPTVISQAELEEKEIEEIKKYKFQARPVNEHILKNPNCGVQKVQPKETTKPEGFDLETDRRIRERQANRSDNEEEQYEFHANPVPKNILERPVGIRPLKALPITVAESPAFALKHRLRSYKQQMERELQQETKHPIQARPVPHPGLPFHPVLPHKTTEFHPFSFEERTKRMLAKKDDKFKKMLEDEKKMREFHANPLPSPTPDSLPDKCPKPLTIPEPFDLKIDHRGSRYAEEWASKVEEELRQQRAVAQFKARPPVSIYKAPFIPKPSTKPPTDVQEFELSTEQRKERWDELERCRKEREAEIAQVQTAMERRRQEEEEEEIRCLRNAAIHQAKPVRHYKPVEIKPSVKPLTITESPRFSQRLRSRTQHNSGIN